MENMGGGGHEQEAMDLPPGFRFHPTDEELISHYLTPKAVDNSFCAVAIGEVDLNKCEPWDLPRKAKMGEKEWYFFCVKDRKYPTGMRTNRATDAGYWKATGKDKEIFRGRALVGMKKTLVFYRGRAPKGEKSNWVMHEYRLEGRISLQNLPSNAKNEWVICRIFHKNAGGKKIAYPILTISNSFNSEFSPSGHLPPLMESSPSTGGGQTKLGTSHVSCFSNPINPAGAQSSQPDPNFSYSDTFFNNDLYHSLPSTSNPIHYFPRLAGTGPVYPPQSSNFAGDFMFSGQQFLRSILDNNEGESKQGMKTEGVNHSASQETGLSHDMNAEIISVVSNFSPGPRSFEDLDAPSTSSYAAFLNFPDV